MKIEVWSDYVCPFCYIGKARLERALEQFPNKENVEVEFKSFQLDPDSGAYSGESYYELLATKYGMSVEQAKQNSAQIGAQAEQEGLTFNFDEMKPANTFAAHRLAKFAKDKGKEAEVTEKLLHAYFTESKNLGDDETLADIAEASGLERQEALRVLNSKDDYADDVQADLSLAQQYGVTGVPFFVINQKYAISGAQPFETFVDALEKVWEEESAKPKFQTLDSESGGACTDESCDVPSQEND